jgi:shikimate kinase
MGSGKSAVAFAVAALLGRSAVDLDRVVEHSAGDSVAGIFEKEGEAGFRRREAEALAEQLNGPVVVALGGGALAEARSLKLVKALAASVWLDAPLDILWQRAGKDPTRPLAQDRAAFEKLFRARRAQYAKCDHRLDADRPVLELAQEVVRLCGG